MSKAQSINLLKPGEVDVLLRYPAGRTAKLAKAGLIPSIVLPDGEVRINAAEIKRLLAKSAEGGSHD